MSKKQSNTEYVYPEIDTAAAVRDFRAKYNPYAAGDTRSVLRVDGGVLAEELEPDETFTFRAFGKISEWVENLEPKHHPSVLVEIHDAARQIRKLYYLHYKTGGDWRLDTICKLEKKEDTPCDL